MQRYANAARVTRAAAPDGSLVLNNQANTEWGMGQNPLTAPSVFNWFRPNHSPSGPLGSAGLVGPEFQILNEFTVVNGINMIGGYLQSGFLFRPDGPQPNLSRWTALADRPDALVDDLDLLLVAGAMSAGTRAAIVQALRGIPTTMTAWQRERALTAFYLTIASPDYLIQK